MNPDYSQLYTQLGIGPDSCVETLKQAYRRRISELHPDRITRVNPSHNPTIELSVLNALYSSALRFHKDHGRFPGSKLTDPSASIISLPSQAIQEARSVPATPIVDLSENTLLENTLPSESPLPQRSSSHKKSNLPMIFFAVLLLLSIFVFIETPTPEVPNSVESKLGTEPAAASDERTLTLQTIADSPPVQHLEIGMNEATVRSLQGDALQIVGERWEYGPSWVQFENGLVVDWYNSPLYPLHTTHIQPRQSPL